jgi:uncharacterized protein involved in exopolysaccharide biosynthesis
MEEIAIFDVLRRHIYVILALGIVATLAGYGFSFVLLPQTYEASALLLVRPHQPIKIDAQNTSKEFLDFPVSQMSMVDTAAKTYIEIIKSPALVEQVVRQLKLDQERKKKAGNGVFASIGTAVQPLFDDVRAYFQDAVAIVRYGGLLKEDPFAKAVKRVSKGLELKSYQDTYVFQIASSNVDPQEAADVANTTAALFIKFMEELRSSEAKNSSEHLKNELERSRERLVNARLDLENYKNTHRVFLYQSEYDAKLKVISDLEVELAKLNESLAGSRGTLAAQTYEARRGGLLEILNARRAELAGMPEIERELQLREADVAVADTAYKTVAKALKDAEMKTDPAPEAQLISSAGVPQLPSKPRRGLIVLAAMLSGLLAGAVLAFFIEYINRRVRRIQDIEDFVGLKVLGTIPRTLRHPG